MSSAEPLFGPEKPASEAQPSRALRLWRAIAPMQAWSLWAVLLAGLAIGLLTTQPPRPRPINAPSAAFSAERAFADVKVIGAATHPTGSPQAELVRRYVFDRLASLGLAPEIRMAQAAETRRSDPGFVAVAALQNILATLPGTDPSLPAVLVMAHSDSVPNSPGAADDGAGVAALLETARSLAADKPHPRTVMFLVTDGEEPGLLGARGFFERDPAAQRVWAVLNMDTRGDAGRAAMFQLGPTSGGLLGVYARTAQAPYANSLTAVLFKILPNDTDFTLSIAHDKPGLNFAFIGDQLAYHTPLSTPAHLSKASLQSMGGQLLPVARALADADTLPAARAPAAYGDVFGLFVTPLPMLALILLWVAAAALLAFSAWRGWKGGLVRPLEALRGAGVGLLATLAAALVLTAAGAMLGADNLRIYALVARYALLLAGCALLATATVLLVLIGAAQDGRGRAATGGVVVAALLTQVGGWSAPPLVIALAAIGLAWAALRQSTGAWALWVGCLVLGLGFSLLLLVIAPGAAPLVLLPTLFGAAAAAAVFGAGAAERWARWALAFAGLLAAVAVGWLCGWASGLFVAAGPMLPALLSLFVLLMLLGTAPFARWWSGLSWAPASAACVAAIGSALLAWTGLAPPSATRPIPTLATVVKIDDAPARLVAPARRLDPWTRALLGRSPEHGPLAPVYERPVWSAPAPAAAPPKAPMIEAVRIDGRVILHLRPDGEARRLSLWLRSDTDLTVPRADARALPWRLTPKRWSRLDFHAPPPEGFTLSLAAPAGAQIDVAVGQLVDGWPKGAAPPPLPRGYMAYGDSGSQLGVKRWSLRP